MIGIIIVEKELTQKIKRDQKSAWRTSFAYNIFRRLRNKCSAQNEKDMTGNMAGSQNKIPPYNGGIHY